MRRGMVGVAGVIGLVIAVGLPGSAVAAKKPKTRAFTSTSIGARISSNGNSNEVAAKLTDSLSGNGAAILDATVSSTTFPISGTGKTTSYFANGVGISTSTFSTAAPDANGISVVTGSGKCAGGTRAHKKEKCTFTVTGTYNTKTSVTAVKAVGTTTL